jgi:hypothetical protein
VIEGPGFGDPGPSSRRPSQSIAKTHGTAGWTAKEPRALPARWQEENKMKKLVLKFHDFSFETRFGLVQVDRWSSEAVAECAEWCKKNGVPFARVLEVRKAKLDAVDGMSPPPRRSNQSRRAYRKAVREWRVAKHGSIQQMRRDMKAQQVKEARWAMFVEQGLPLKDVEAVLWYMKKHAWDDDGIGKYGYLNESELAKVCGGTLPMGFDFAEAFSRLTKNGRRERGKRNHVRDAPTEKPNKKKEMHETMLKAIRHAYDAANVRHKNELACEVRVSGWNSIKEPPAFSMTDTKDRYARRRRGRSIYSTRVQIVVNPDWYRRVYRAGLANVFGPRTLVIDVNQNGLFTVAIQRNEVRYAVEVVNGWMEKDKDGNAVLKEV